MFKKYRQILLLFLVLNLIPPSIIFATLSINVRQNANPYGVVSYGVTDNLSTNDTSFLNGNWTVKQLTPDPISTNAVYGCVNITTISAYNPSLLKYNDGSAYISTLQLNVNLQVNLENNTNETYWLQDSITFNTSNQSYFVSRDVYSLDMVKKLVGMNRSYGISSYPEMSWRRYSLPFVYCPEISTMIQNNHAHIMFGYKMNNKHYTYNTTVLNLSHVKFASFLITPFQIGPIGDGYDLEFIFGGINGQNMTFNSLNAKDMWIFYNDNGTIKPFPSVFTFGGDTGEGAYDLRVFPSNNYATVTVGIPDPYVNIALTGNGNKTEFFGNTTETVSYAIPNITNLEASSKLNLFGGWIWDILSVFVIVIILILVWFYGKVIG